MTPYDDTLPALIRPDSMTTPIVEQVADRYDVLSILGAGAFGSVYRGLDTVSSRPMAIKFLRAFDQRDLERFRRETATLRLLRLPGVVEVLDDGITAAGVPWVAMELVDGRPFPGDPRKHTWDELAEATHGLLETVARVHHLGVLHLDLKPDNILVGAESHVTLLDFGISNSPRYRELTEVAGSPAYVAPEQVFRRDVDERADIFAIGVMLFEALTGERPFDTDTLTMVMATRMAVNAPSITEFETDAPTHVVETIDAMLAADPVDRPRYVEDVMERLGQPTASAPTFRLGPTRYVDTLLALVGVGQSEITIGGPTGSGRTRLLEDTAAALETNGHQTSPWPPAPGADVCFIDDDDETSESDVILARESGIIIVRTVTSRGAHIELQPLLAQELEDLFHGPELVLALKSRSASELHRRTGGFPKTVMAELGAWIRAGICFWDDGRIRIDHLALSRLGLTDHALASLTGNGPRHKRGSALSTRADNGNKAKTIDSGRVAGETDEHGPRAGAAEALRQALVALEQGTPWLAFIAAEWAMSLAAAAGADGLRCEALYTRVAAALYLAEPNSVRVVLYEAAQAGSWCPANTDLVELCDLTLRGPDAEIRFSTPKLPTELLEHLHHRLYAQRLVESKGADTYAGQRLVDWAHGNPTRTRRVGGWIGLLRDTQLDFDEAHRWHLYAAQTDDRAVSLGSLQNAGFAAVEMGRLDLALELADAVQRQASHFFPRLSMIAAIDRAQISYRLGQSQPEEWDPILEVVDILGEEHRKAMTYLFGGAAMWRSGRWHRAREWAERGAAVADETYRGHVTHTLCAALACVCGDSSRDVNAFVQTALDDTQPGTRLQSLALLHLAGADIPDAAAHAERAVTELADPTPERRREVLSTNECVQLLRFGDSAGLPVR